MRNYWKPDCAFVGDCMPFYHNGVFHLYYLWDVDHHNHPLVGNHGGHEWAHRSSTDLIHWTDHEMALPLNFTDGERSNCTGSLFAADDGIYAFYALRCADFPGEERLRYAISRDGGMSFEKLPITTPDCPPEGYGKAFRDPCVFQSDDKRYHMLITSQDSAAPDGANGVLLHYESATLTKWENPSVWLRTTDAPECPDYFAWNGWYYLFYSIRGATYYRYSQAPDGPWIAPESSMLGCSRFTVFKTAAYHNNRRIAVGFLGTYTKDTILYGGRAVFRELLQNTDGTLMLAQVPEWAAPTNNPVKPKNLILSPEKGLTYCKYEMPTDVWQFSANCRLENNCELGFIATAPDGRRIREVELIQRHNVLSLDRDRNILHHVTDLHKPFQLEILKYADVLEVSINHRIFAISSGEPCSCGAFVVYIRNGLAEIQEQRLELDL